MSIVSNCAHHIGSFPPHLSRKHLPLSKIPLPATSAEHFPHFPSMENIIRTKKHPKYHSYLLDKPPFPIYSQAVLVKILKLFGLYDFALFPA